MNWLTRLQNGLSEWHEQPTGEQVLACFEPDSGSVNRESLLYYDEDPDLLLAVIGKFQLVFDALIEQLAEDLRLPETPSVVVEPSCLHPKRGGDHL